MADSKEKRAILQTMFTCVMKPLVTELSNLTSRFRRNFLWLRSPHVRGKRKIRG